jgi:hypothetical protein
MRKTVAAIAVVTAIVAAGSVMPTRANATGLSIAVGSAINEIDVATPVTYGCRRVWRCGPFGCGFRSVCFGPPVHAYSAYGFYRPWRHHWHHRHWHRPHWRW